ncbi:MAG: hypothetical protein L0227_14505 [Chloroflexi bacterium]|nr:hypothetical protein [Chloroflexota bacterium]
MADTQRLQPAARTHGATEVPVLDIVIRSGIVALALATGAIHLTLGGLLFTLNAIGYFVAAIAMVVPLALAARFRGLIRLGLIGYAATTIVGWYLMGPRYETAYIAKAIEVALIGLLAIELRRVDGNPVAIVRGAIGALLAALRPSTHR